MRPWGLLLLLACGNDAKDAPRRIPAPGDARIAVAIDAALVKGETYPDLGSALQAVVPADARVIGFGELHSRTDRAQVKSSLARFTADGLPAIANKLSDLIVETWIVDPKCGQAAKTATAKVEMTVRRPQETKSEIAMLAETARAAKVQPHAMTLTCEDYEKVAPSGKDVKPEVMLGLITAELGRIADEAIAYRTKQGNPRPWIALYGGALHNDRFPAAGVEDWSYAARVDKTTGDKYVEVDLIVPELAEADENTRKEPWFPLVERARDQVQVYKRGERSFVVIFPRTPEAAPTP